MLSLPFLRSRLPLGALALALCCASPAAEPTLPILAWHGPPASESTPERFRELADAGFTQSFSGFSNTETFLRALDVAQATGLQLWASVPELQSDPEGTVAKLRGHPALAGYYLRDEPTAADFPALATWAKRIQAADPVHPCYINLFPNYANTGQLGVPTYREHVTRFLAEVPVPILSFDHYPVIAPGGKVGPQSPASLRGEWYQNLEIVSHAAAEAKKPFWAFVLAVAHNPYPIPTIEHLRLQAFSNLTYGAQSIQHFTYWTPKSDVWNFHQAPIETNGQKTPTYAVVKQLNAEIRGWSSVFLGAKVVQVGHLGPLPRGTKEFQPLAPIFEVRADGPAIVSVLEKGDSRFLVIMNRALEGDRHAEIKFAAGAAIQRIRINGDPAPFKESVQSETILPGSILVYSWKR